MGLFSDRIPRGLILQVTGQVFYRAMYYRTGPIKMNPHQFSYKPADKVDYRFLLGEAIKSARGTNHVRQHSVSVT